MFTHYVGDMIWSESGSSGATSIQTEAFVRYPLLPEAKINGRLFHGSVGNQIDSVRDTFYRDRVCKIKSEL